MRTHPLLRRRALDVKGSAAREVPTEMREHQRREGLGVSLGTPLSVTNAELLEFDPSRLVPVQFQSEPRSPFPKLLKEPLDVHSPATACRESQAGVALTTCSPSLAAFLCSTRT
jgi:hypothetical protein